METLAYVAAAFLLGNLAVILFIYGATHGNR